MKLKSTCCSQQNSRSKLRTNLTLPVLGLTAALILPASAATILVDTEATVRGLTGESGATVNQDEATVEYIFVKHHLSNASRKGYFQFDLTGQNADLSQAATFSMFLQNTFDQEIQVWALDQAYSGFTDAITWDTAQANELGTNDMLTTGGFTATQIGASNFVTGGVIGFEVQTSLTSLAPFVFDNKITFAVTGVSNALNESGGLRLNLGASELDFVAVPEPSSTALLGLGGLALILRRRK